MMLVCTDRASRGLDAADVSHVILRFPDQSTYAGRHARWRWAGHVGEVSVLVLGRQVRLAREIMRRNTRGDPWRARRSSDERDTYVQAVCRATLRADSISDG